MRTLNAVVAAAYIANVVLTFLSITGAYGHTNSELSRKYQSLATPAGYAFAIWGVIFTSETVYAFAQCLPCLRDADEVKAAGPWFASASVFQAAWSVAFGFERIYLAQALILLILVSLLRTNACLQSVARNTPPSWGRYALCYLPFTIHFGWLTAASVVSVNLTLVATAPTAHVALLAVAVVSLTVAFLPALVNPATAATGADPGYALTVAWALAGVAVQNRSPLDEAPAADPILGWCPTLVTDALAAVAATLAAAIVVSVLARKVAHLAAWARRPRTVEPTLVDALWVGPKP